MAPLSIFPQKQKRNDHFVNCKEKLNILPQNPEKRGKGRFPSWLHRKLPRGNLLIKTRTILEKHHLYTVCEEGKCPNHLECFSKQTAAFLALGKECTRACGFCNIAFSNNPTPPAQDEPKKIAQSVKSLALRHVVITMVARDDLPDQGATHIGKIIEEVHRENMQASIEVLTSDFSGNEKLLDIILDAKPEIFNHNIETVRRLTPHIRHRATYERSLAVLSYVKTQNRAPLVKSGIMVGLGETQKEVEETIRDLCHAGCSIITIGQYLQPASNKLRVKAFIHPQQFKHYEKYGYAIGVRSMHCAPFVRSSYNANLLKRDQ